MKAKTIFYCTQCGNETPKWQGQCSACGSWNTIVEQPSTAKVKRGSVKSAIQMGPARKPKLVAEMTLDQEIRFPTGLAELTACWVAEQYRAPWFSSAALRESANQR